MIICFLFFMITCQAKFQVTGHQKKVIFCDTFAIIKWLTMCNSWSMPSSITILWSDRISFPSWSVYVYLIHPGWISHLLSPPCPVKVDNHKPHLVILGHHNVYIVDITMDEACAMKWSQFCKYIGEDKKGEWFFVATQHLKVICMTTMNQPPAIISNPHKIGTHPKDIRYSWAMHEKVRTNLI